MTSVSATDAVFEDRVEITWSGAVGASSVVRVERDAEVIGVVASDVKIFEDTAADPRVSYQYCVIVTVSDGSDSTPVCDNGTRGFFAPTGMTASDRLFEGHVLLTWTDRSQRETEYRIIRRLASESQFGGLVTLPANASSYRDTTAVVGVEYRYGVAPHDADGFRSVFAFDNGERAAVTPPADVSASDGQYPNFVRLTWTDQSDQEDAFIIYRNTVEIGTVSSNTTTFDDAAATTAVIYNYCVASVVGGVESVQVCDDGMRGGLRPPSNVAATDDRFDDRVSISWNDDADTEDGFEVYRKVLGQIDSTLITSLPAGRTSFDDLNAEQQVDYMYCVRSFSNADPGATSHSTSACDTGRRAGVLAPETVAASDDDFENRVDITWSSSSTTVMLFKIYRDGVLIRTVDPEARSFSDRQVDAGVAHEYGVSAVTVIASSAAVAAEIAAEIMGIMEADERASAEHLIMVAQGASDPVDSRQTAANADELYKQLEAVVVSASSAGVAAEIVESATVVDNGSREIGAPASLEVTYDEAEDHVRISWLDASSVEIGYYIYRNGNVIDSVGASRASYGDYMGEPGVEHEYGVSAFDEFGQSRIVSAPGLRRLATPTQVDASDGLFEDHVRVTWTDNSRVEIGYVVFRDGAAIDTTATNVTEYRDFSAPLGATTTYGVAAIDTYGSSAVGDDDGLASILSPGSFNASESYSDRVVLTWIDRSIVETGYRVTREDLNTTVKQTLVVLGPGATGYSDATAAPVTDYQYCVESAGTGGVFSPPVCDFGARIPPPETNPPPVFTMLAPSTAVTATDEYGYSVTIDSAFAAVGAPSYNGGQGGIFFFERVNGVWSETQVVTGGSLRRELGRGVKMDYPYLIATAPGFVSGSGNFADQSAYIFRHDGSTWIQEYDSFIEPVIDTGLNIDNHRDFALIGNPDFENCCGAGRVGEAYLLKRRADGSTWDRIGNPIQQPGGFSGGLGGDANWQNSDFGWSVDIADDFFIIGAPSFLFDFDSDPDGRAVIFSYNTSYSVAAFLEVPGQDDIRFGSAVAITEEFAFVGAFDQDLKTGRVYVYAFDEGLGQWNTTPQHVLEVPGGAIDGRLFRDMAASKNVFVLGAYGEDINPGAVYTSVRSGAGWGDFTDQFTLASLPGENFGWSVDLSGDTLAVGAPGNGTVAGAAHVIDDFGGEELPPDAPTDVSASDGTHDDRIRVTWTDTYEGQASFEILRDGELIPDNIEPGATSYNDYRAAPGAVHSYCVRALTSFGTSVDGCDIGRRPPNGALAGRIASRSGSSVGGATLCLSPSPNRGLLLDGEGGGVIVDPVVPTTDMSICAWVRSTASATQHIVTWTNSDGSDRIDVKMDAGKLVFSSTDPATTSDITGSTTINTGDWVHVCAIVSAGTATLHVDGVADGSGPAGTNAVVDLMTIGATPDGDVLSDAFGGQLDEVKLWNHARSTEQVAADRLARASGREAGLLGYWPFNQTAGVSAADLTTDPHYGLLAGGVYWTPDGAPIDACANTDEQGNYSFTGLQYGSATTFRVTPTLGARQFDPGFKTINLSVDNPVQNEVDFIDVSAFTVSGVVNFSNTECPVPNVEVFVDGEFRGASELDGTFAVAADIGLDRLVEPRLGAANDRHRFVPADTLVDVANDVLGLFFADTKERVLSGFFGGSCETDIGSATLRVFTENGCFDQEFVVQGNFQFDLPPQRYLVQVKDIDATKDDLRADILSFYDRMGVVEVDLTVQDDTVNLVYHAPLRVAINGLPEPPGICSALTTESGRVLPAVPVLRQTQTAVLSMEVFEDFGGGDLCPVESGIVTVFDEVADRAGEPVELDLAEGVAEYETIGGTPSVFAGRSVEGVDRSFQKSIAVVAEVEGRDPETTTEWAIVEGRRARTATFVSATTDEIPLLVVHDPPGDRSFSYLAQGTSTCRTLTKAVSGSQGGGVSTELKFGIKFQAGFPFVAIESKAQIKLKAQILLGTENSRTTEGLQVCATVEDERFATSGSPTHIGNGADLYVGTALNLIFAKADEVQVDASSCTLDLSETLAMDLDDSQPFATTYIYTESHIKNSVIPQLENLIELAGDGQIESEDGDRTSLQGAIDNWTSQVETNASNRVEALEAPDENLSFAAGADYSFSSGVDSTVVDKAGSHSFFIRSSGGVGPLFGISGNQSEVLIIGEFNRTWSTDSSRTTSTSEAVGYVLSDDDVGDFFTIDVAEDPDYGTPVFGLRSGTSSEPWEPGPDPDSPLTQPRDRPLISINPPQQLAVDPTGPAVYTLSMTHAGDSEEAREYMLRTIHTSNPGGAVLRAQGAPIHAGISFWIEPQQTQEVTLEVFRGPNRYEYDDLAVQLYAPGEYVIWIDGGVNGNGLVQLADTVHFTTRFKAPCSDIAVLRPLDNWIINASTIGDSLAFDLHEFSLQVSESDAVQSLGLEYRIQGTPDWLPARQIQASQLAPDATSWSARWRPARDGAYEVRAFTSCQVGGRVNSDPVPGIVDTKPPLVFGAPEPGDEILALGDNISITFDEAMECGSIDTDGVGKNTTLTYIDGPNVGTEIPITPVCDGRTVVLVPDGGYDWTQAENRLLQVDMLTGVVDGQSNPSVAADLAGNPISDPIAWQFTVQRSAFTWSPTNLTMNILGDTELKASLVNGRAQEVAYTLGNVPAWLSPSVGSGSLPPGGTETIDFEVDVSLLTPGTLDTLAARTAAGDALLYLRAVCELDAWTVDAARFQYSMTVTGQLFIDGLVSDDTNDRVAAFVGSELRGVANVADVAAGSNRVNLTVYSNNPSGETVTMRVFDASACRVFAGTDRTFTFLAGSGLGTPEQPVAINATDELEQQAISLAAGWTWFSLNREPGSTNVPDILSSVLGRAGDVVKSQTAFSIYDPGLGSWVGSLNSIEVGRTYLIKLANANTLVLGGPEVDPAGAPVDVVAGWNWIGYVPQVSMTVDDALASLAATATTDDLIKSQYQFAQYDGSSWVGSLTQMDPGLGYLLKADAPGTILYPSVSAQIAGVEHRATAEAGVTDLQANDTGAGPSGTSRDSGTGGALSGNAVADGKDARSDLALERSIATEGRDLKPQLETVANGSAGSIPLWRIDRDQYAHSMTVTAEVQIDGVASDGKQLLVAAFVDDELRGMARTRRVGSIDRDLLFLMVYSNEPKGEPVTFRVYDASDERTYVANEEVVFSTDAVTGKPSEPLVLTVGAVAAQTETADELPTEFALRQNYPNPFNPVTTIRYELPTASRVEITLFDVLGREVTTLLNTDRKAGRYDLVVDASTLASGMYVYRIEAGDFRDLRKMMVIK